MVIRKSGRVSQYVILVDYITEVCECRVFKYLIVLTDAAASNSAEGCIACLHHCLLAIPKQFEMKEIEKGASTSIVFSWMKKTKHSDLFLAKIIYILQIDKNINSYDT